METKDKLIALRNDPRKCLKAIRLKENPSFMFCDRCNKTVRCEPKTTELSRRADNETLVFFQRCPDCGHKLYWKEFHCFIPKNLK